MEESTLALDQNRTVTKEASKDPKELPDAIAQIDLEMLKEAELYESHAQAVFDENEESQADANDVLFGATHNIVLGRRQLKEERSKTKLRRSQAIIHMSYTDIRIGQLEEQIKRLRRIVNDASLEDFEPAVEKWIEPVYKHELKVSNNQEFHLTEESAEIPYHLRPALEVLVTIPGPDSVIGPMTKSGATHVEVAERLRLRPYLLIKHLIQVTDTTSLQQSGQTGITGVKNPSAIVIIRPFKILVQFDKEIRLSLEELQEKMSKSSIAGAAETMSTGESLTETALPQASNMEVKPADKDTTLPDNENKSSAKGTGKYNSPDPDKSAPGYGDKDLILDLELLIHFMDRFVRPLIVIQQRAQEGTLVDIQFHDLWHLFRLGDDIVRVSDLAIDRPTAYRVIKFTGGRELLSPNSDKEDDVTPLEGFTIDAYSLEYNGTEFGPKLHHFTIRKYQGYRPVQSLPVFPLRCAIDYTILHERLVSQGQAFLDLTKSPYCHRTFTGRTMDDSPEEIDAQIIVDMSIALSKNPQWQSELRFDEDDLTEADYREVRLKPHCKHVLEGCCSSDVIEADHVLDQNNVNSYLKSKENRLRVRPSSELVIEEYTLLPNWIRGFVLRSRQWVTMRTKDLSNVIYRNTFESLVLPEQYKYTVQALVSNHARDSTTESNVPLSVSATIELVRGKGKGLIILLHGEPGVGKTSTAECVADLTRRPLFPITCGDIGETAREVQSNLDSSFQLAHRWGCVLLLDEADVFMARRNKTDLRRNAVVSIFLRTLEYYSGILFLTTNRVGTIDPAFKSRIHLALRYPRLELEATKKLYKIMIDRTIKEQEVSGRAEFKVKPEAILKFGEKHFRSLQKRNRPTWNGRQIRNAFQTAITLAEYEARQPDAKVVPLGKKQFSKVAKASREFDKYMTRTQGGTDSQVAMQEQVRYDLSGTPKTGSKSGKRGSTPSKTPTSRYTLAHADTSSEDTSESDDDDDDDDTEDTENSESEQTDEVDAPPAKRGKRIEANVTPQKKTPKSKKYKGFTTEDEDESDDLEKQMSALKKKMKLKKGKGPT